MKADWKDNYCSVCDEGGDLIICDGCDSPIHMACVKPPLSVIPEGDWFCHFCQDKKGAVLSPMSQICTGKRRFSLEGRSGSCKYESDTNSSPKKKTSNVLFSEAQKIENRKILMLENPD